MHSKDLCGRIRIFQPLGFWRTYMEKGKLPRTALPCSQSLGLAESGILKAHGQKFKDLKDVCGPDTLETIFP